MGPRRRAKLDTRSTTGLKQERTARGKTGAIAHSSTTRPSRNGMLSRSPAWAEKGVVLPQRQGEERTLMMSLLSVGSAIGSNQARLRSSLEVAPTIDPLTAGAGGSPTWSITPSWCVAKTVLPSRLGRPDDKRSPMSPSVRKNRPSCLLWTGSSPEKTPHHSLQSPSHPHWHPEDGHEVGGDG